MLRIVFLSLIGIFGFTHITTAQPPHPARAMMTDHREEPPARALRRTVQPAAINRGKSPAKAFLFSALFPGAGQWYAGRRHGLAFSLIEAGGWTSYLLFRNEGDDRTRRTLAFADAHWDGSRCLPECESGPETLEPAGSQQYYEQIGKWDQFQSGWDDFAPGQSGLSPNRAAYVAMRRDMNKPYEWASWTAGALLFNHVVSAIHAALIVRNDNRATESGAQESRLRLRIEAFDPYGRMAPSATVSVRF